MYIGFKIVTQISKSGEKNLLLQGCEFKRISDMKQIESERTKVSVITSITPFK